MADPGVVAIVAPNWLGDAVMALPAIGDVRRRFGHARLVVAARRSVSGLFAIVPGVDQVVDLEWRGRVMHLAAMARDVARLLRRRVRSWRSCCPTHLRRRGWRVARESPNGWGYAGDLRRSLLTRAIEKPRQSLHQGAYYQSLLQPLGVPSGPLEARVVVHGSARARPGGCSRCAGGTGRDRSGGGAGCGVWHREALAARSFCSRWSLTRDRSGRALCAGRQRRRQRRPRRLVIDSPARPSARVMTHLAAGRPCRRWPA